MDGLILILLLTRGDRNPVMNYEGHRSYPAIKGIITMTEPDDKFQMISRRGSNIVGNHSYTPTININMPRLSANADVYDLANVRAAVPEPLCYRSRNRPTHQSVP